MQYIQLQGQVASQLDLPLEGSYNLFIDTSDNSIKAKDSDGQLHGGGGLSLTELTREEIGQLVASASLTPGAFYKITGAASQSFLDALSIEYTGAGNEIQDGGTTIILQATTDKTLSKKGIGLFYVPNYEDINYPTVAPDYNYEVWDPTSRLYFTNLSGVFDHDEAVTLYSNGEDTQTDAYIVANTGNESVTIVYDSSNNTFLNQSANYDGLTITGYNSNVSASITGCDYTSSYNVGDKVIWGGRVWTNRSGSIGHTQGSWPNTQLTLNDEDWTVVPFNETNYTIVADLIEYEFEVDNISYRRSANNVEVRSSFKIWSDYWGYNMIKYFPWGHTNIQDISISNSYLDAFVNYPHDSYAGEIKFADYGGFNAHYWGHSTEIYGIDGDSGAHMVSLNLGYNTNIYNIKLGLESRIEDIYTYDNDTGTNALNNITLGNNAEISSNASDPIYIYYGSYMENLELDTNSHIGDINLYPHSRITDTKLGINSYIESIALGNYSDFRQVEIGNSSYILYINTGVSSCFKRVKLGTDSYINAVGIWDNGYFKHVEMADQSSIDCVFVGDASYFEYITLDVNSSISSIAQGYYTSSFIPYSNSSFQYITLGNNSSIGGILLTNNTTLSDFQIGANSGFGGLNIYSGSSITDFEIGENSGFGGYDITSSISNVTISRGFNNFLNNQTFTGISGSAYTQQSDLPYIDFDNRGVVVIDITDFPAETVNYRLDDGNYEGQEIKFVVRNNSNIVLPAPTDVRIWADHLQYPIQYNPTGYVTYCSFGPFAHYDPTFNGGGGWIWRTMGTAIWTNGAWVTDAEYYYD